MEKSQDQIKFENLFSKSLTTWWSNYKLGSLGNIIHWIYVYTSLNIAEIITVGNGEVHYREKLLARFTLNDKLDMPIFFDIDDDPYPYFSENQQRYITGLTRFPEFVGKMTQLKEQFTDGEKK